jgi:hypothetical protein
MAKGESEASVLGGFVRGPLGPSCGHDAAEAVQSFSYKKAVLQLCKTAKASRGSGDLTEARYWLSHLMELRVTHNFDAP